MKNSNNTSNKKDTKSENNQSFDSLGNMDDYFNKIQAEELNQQLLRAKGSIPELSDYLMYKVIDIMQDDRALLAEVINVDDPEITPLTEISSISNYLDRVLDGDLLDNAREVIAKFNEMAEEELSIRRNIYITSFIKQAQDVTINLEETFEGDDLESKPVKTVRKSTFRFTKNVKSIESQTDKSTE